jgi:siderophore synthetase component
MKPRIICSEREGRWVARAFRDDNGDPFGIECTAATRQEAVERLERWLDWQREHAAALEALQQAERAYHRTIAGSAFANPSEGPTAIELQKESLEAVEAARVRLDEIRARRPEA